MLEPKVVLAPIDFSDASLDAMETATGVASRFGATLVLVYVVPALPRLPAGVSIFKEEDYERGLHTQAVARIGELSARCAKAGVSVVTEVGTANDVGTEILRISTSHKADLIVMATHGTTGWHDRVFGSVAEKIVRMASSAVLVIKSPPGNKR